MLNYPWAAQGLLGVSSPLGATRGHSEPLGSKIETHDDDKRLPGLATEQTIGTLEPSDLAAHAVTVHHLLG